MVVHGHIFVNNRKINIPSYEIKVGDIISLRKKSIQNEMFVENFNNTKFIVQYIDRDVQKFSAKLINIPDRKEIPIKIDDHLIIE